MSSCNYNNLDPIMNSGSSLFPCSVLASVDVVCEKKNAAGWFQNLVTFALQACSCMSSLMSFYGSGLASE